MDIPPHFIQLLLVHVPFMFSHVKQYDQDHVRQVAYPCTGEQIGDKWLEKVEQRLRIVKYYVQEVNERN